MRNALALLALLLTCLPAYAQTVTTSGISAAAVSGTATNDSASAGFIGQLIEANCANATSGASVSFTNGANAVGTWTAGPWSGAGTFACPFNITANPPTGLSTATNYWLIPIDANTFHIATTAANAIAGTFATTSGTSSTANLTSNASITTGTTGVATAVVSLAAGDWDCSGSTFWTPAAATSITNLQESIGTSATLVGVLGAYSDWETAANVITATNKPVLTTPLVRESLAAATTINLVSLGVFSVDILNATSDLRCRRVR